MTGKLRSHVRIFIYRKWAIHTIESFHSRGHHLCKFIRTKNLKGVVCNTDMAAVSLFWNTNTSAVTSCENDLYQLHNIEKKKCKTFLAYKLYLSHLSGSCQVFCPFYLLSLVLGVLFWVCCITFNIWRATRGDRAKRLERSVSDSFLNASKASIYKPNFSLHYLFIGTIIWSPGAFR